MTNRTQPGFLLLVLAAGLAGCNGVGSSSSPTVPSPRSQQTVPPPDGQPPGWSYGNGYTLNGVTLFGVVSETTPTGHAPLADATVYCDACGEFGHTEAQTDANGYYRFGGNLDSGGGIWLSGSPTSIWVGKEGYQDPPGLPPPPAPAPSGPGWRAVLINGDTRFDLRLVKR